MIPSFTPGYSYYPGTLRAVLTSTRLENSAISVTIYPIFLKEIILEWTIPKDWGLCTFNVYKSQYEGSTTTYQKVNLDPIKNTFFYKDTTTVDVSKFRDHQYVVECRLPSGQYIRSPSVTWQNKRSSWVELRAKEIQRRESLLLRKFVGVDALVFRRRMFGKRCTNCWNPKMEKVTTDNCPVCIGTSFEGGYFPGYPIKVQFEPTPNNSALDGPGILEANSIPAWTIAQPNIHVFDLVYRIPDAKLYRADQVSTTELQTVAVRQTLNLVELDKNSIEFNLALQALPAHLR